MRTPKDRKFAYAAMIAILSIFASFGTWFYYFTMAGYQKLDLQNMNDSLERVQRAVVQAQDHLESKARDWAVFDDIYFFMDKPNPAFLDQLFSYEAGFIPFKIQFLLITKKSGEIVFFKHLNDRGDKTVDGSPYSVSFLSDIRFDSTTPTRGFGTYEGRPLIYAAHPIMMSSRKSDANGQLIYAEFLHKSVLDTINEATLLNTVFTPKHSSAAGKELDTELAKLYPKEAVFERGHVHYNDEAAVGFVPITDKKGETLGAFQVSLKRSVVIYGTRNVSYVLRLLGVVAFISCFGLWIYFNMSSVQEKLSSLLQAHQRLQAQETYLRALFETLPGYIAWFDRKGSMIGANPRVGTELGVPLEDFQVKDPDAQLFAQSEPPFTQRLQAFGQSTSPTETFDMFLERGESKRKFVVALEKYDDQNKIMAVIADVTAYWNLEEQHQRDRQAVIKSSRMASLGVLAGGIAHEINNPLAIIRGAAELLQSKITKGTLEPERANEMLLKIVSTTTRIAKIISSLRTFASDGSQDPYKNVNVRDVLQEVMDLCVNRFENNGVRVKWPATIPDITISARHVQITQALVNIMINAFEAVEKSDNPWVKLEVEKKNGMIAFHIYDSGKGISAAIAEKMMDPFFTTKPVGQGTGLGLSICSTIAEDHHGKLIYDATKANTCFSFIIPITQTKKSAQVA